MAQETVKLTRPQYQFVFSKAKFPALIGGLGCVHPCTRIWTEKGLMRIADIVDPIRVLSWNAKSQRFQLSLSGGAFPKGRANLYQVSTQYGEFHSSEHHRIFSSLDTYVPVGNLSCHDELSQSLPSHLPTILEQCLKSSREDGLHLNRIYAGLMGSYANEARLYGLQLQTEEENVLYPAQQSSDAQVLCHKNDLTAHGNKDDLKEPKQSRSHHDLCDDQIKKQGYVYRTLALVLIVASRISSLFSERILGFRSVLPQFRVMFGHHHIKDGLSFHDESRSFLQACEYSLVKEPIISCVVSDVESIYYDMQVLETNNYVCENGFIHHNSGKSQGGTYRVAKLMLEDPGINCGYYFPTYDLINLRGIPGLIKDFETLGITDVSLNKSNYTLSVKGYGDVIFRSYDSPDRIIAYEVAHSIVDEIDTLTKDKASVVWRKVVERNRQECNHEHGNTVGCVTTPDQGQLGFVFEKWGGIELQDGYELIKASTYSNPFLPADYADNILKNYNADLAKLYLEGDFVSLSHRTVFDREKMEAALKECWKPKARKVLENKRFVDRDNGELRVWYPPKPSERYCIGADVAEGEYHDKGDYSCADVVDMYGNQVAQWHGRIPPDAFADVLHALGKWYNTAFIGVEANNHGILTNVMLRNANYPHLYVRRDIDDRGGDEKETRRIGWLTDRKNKPYIIDMLSKELRLGTHGLCCKETVQEMQTFVVKENGSYGAQQGMHDDRVMSYAIAQEMARLSPGYRKS